MEIDRKLKRVMPQYEEGHFDRVIRGYRECTASNWDPFYSNADDANPFVQQIVAEMQTKIKEIVPRESFDSFSFIAPHILDLRDGKSGIDPHIDYLDASGGVIAGLTLISPAVMMFKFKERYRNARYNMAKPNCDADGFKVLIPSNCLYVQWDELRYEYTHSIPMTDSPNHSVDGEFIKRGRRLSLLLRDKKKM